MIWTRQQKPVFSLLLAQPNHTTTPSPSVFVNLQENHCPIQFRATCCNNICVPTLFLHPLRCCAHISNGGKFCSGLTLTVHTRKWVISTSHTLSLPLTKKPEKCTRLPHGEDSSYFIYPLSSWVTSQSSQRNRHNATAVS